MKKTVGVVFITHNVNSMQRVAERCLLLEHGTARKTGDTAEILDVYLRDFLGSGSGKYVDEHLAIGISNEQGEKVSDLLVHRQYCFTFRLKKLSIQRRLLIAFSFVNLVNNFNHRVEIKEYSAASGSLDDFSVRVEFPDLALPPGEYTIRFAVSDGDFLNRIFFRERTIGFKVRETKEQKYLPLIIAGKRSE